MFWGNAHLPVAAEAGQAGGAVGGDDGGIAADIRKNELNLANCLPKTTYFNCSS
ncbi:MAG: hypothetical protein V2B20_10455 [Pseudomonadota bacterium]